MKTKAKLLLPRDLSFTHLPDCELITPNSIENCKKQKRKRWLIYPQAEDPDTQQQAYRMRTQKNTSIKKNKKLPTDPKTNRDLKLGYQSKQPKISTKTSRYSIFTQNRTKPNDFVNRKMRTTTSSACSAACFWRNVTEFALARTSLVPSSLVCSKP